MNSHGNQHGTEDVSMRQIRFRYLRNRIPSPKLPPCSCRIVGGIENQHPGCIVQQNLASRYKKTFERNLFPDTFSRTKALQTLAFLLTLLQETFQISQVEVPKVFCIIVPWVLKLTSHLSHLLKLLLFWDQIIEFWLSYSTSRLVNTS